MRMRKRKKSGDGAAVSMTPLIDCVFLLLIFFLVTSMIKRYERQIPVTLADPTASVADVARADVYVLGLDREGRVYREAGRSRTGIVQFEPIADLPAMLRGLIAERGGGSPVELIVEERTPFQTVIDVLDTLQHHGLERVRSRIRDGDI